MAEGRKKKSDFHVDVVEFAQPLQQYGDLMPSAPGASSGILVGTSLGTSKHHQILLDLDGITEMNTKYVFRGINVNLIITGRADCWQPEAGLVTEVKTTYNAIQLRDAILDDLWHPYRLQVLTYSWLLQRRLSAEIIINSYVDDAGSFKIAADMAEDDFSDWFQLRCKQLVREENYRRRREKLRLLKRSFNGFPFARARQGQERITEHSEKSKPKYSLIQAPTGLGKTTAILMGSLNRALKNGHRLIWLTPKNSQQLAAIDEVRKVNSTLQTMVVTAKNKICLAEKVDCRPSICRFAKDYHEKNRLHKLESRVRTTRNIDAKYLQKLGRDYEVCPHALQKKMLKFSDFVAADFNYVFGHSNAVNVLSVSGREKNVLVIDEAHNLPGRVRDEFSAEFTLEASEWWPESLKQGGDLFNRWVSDGADFSDRKLETIHQLYRLGIAELLSQDIDINELNSVFDNYLAVEMLKAASEMSAPPFTVIPRAKNLKVLCLDASLFIKNQFSYFSKINLFSATLKPFDSFKIQLGIDGIKVDECEMVSPFPKENRKLIFIPQVSTKAKSRASQLQRMKQVIEKLVACKRGNYLVFTPSYTLAEQLHDSVEVDGFEKRIQFRGLSKQNVEYLLDELKQSTAKIVFAVQGGVLAEGINYQGELAIGCFVVGPGLPQFSEENQKMREYFDSKSQNGYQLTYVQPAMVRSIQSAGRIIRSETDRGLLVFIDDRFMREEFYRAFPEDWIDKKPESSQSILNEVKEFWTQ